VLATKLVSIWLSMSHRYLLKVLQGSENMSRERCRYLQNSTNGWKRKGLMAGQAVRFMIRILLQFDAIFVT
jgi:hypothetical protein